MRYYLMIIFTVLVFIQSAHAAYADDFTSTINDIERDRILTKAKELQSLPARTVTADIAARSKGGRHDFFSEGDYWWPDPENPKARYIRRDGETNPDNFIEHRLSLMQFNDFVGTFTSAFLLTGDKAYADRAIVHLKAWFVDEETRMNPSLHYGQAISGRFTGRATGIIDTIHLTEVARSVKLLEQRKAISTEDLKTIKTWFRYYLTWIDSHPYGIREKLHHSNHGVAWSMQAAAFADLLGDEKQLAWIRNYFKTYFLPKMMDANGGFTKELGRTKPYGYSLFVIDLMAGVAEIASTDEDNLWTFKLDDGRGMELGLSFITPYITDKSSWPLKPDVMYWDEWPAKHPALLFAARKLKNNNYLQLWKSQRDDPKAYETRRNLPLRYPLLWQ